ncbi:MAG: Mur ligase family protein, partial [Pseudomonadota bacterium]
DIVIVTNIDPEHLDHYGTFERVQAAFRQFVENVPFYGFAVMCLDHPEVQAMVGRIEDRRIITYGQNPQADVRFMNVRPGVRTVFDVRITDRVTGDVRLIEGLSLPMPGIHNVGNATAAVAVADRLGLDPDAIRRGLEAFRGVKRRFTHVGEWNGVAIYDDYGHHPVEIRAVLAAAREAAEGKVIAVVQPHRYSRLESLFDEFCLCFNDADTVIVADVFAAGEAPIPGADRDSLVLGLAGRGHRDALPLPSQDALAGMIAERARPGDMVICLGAGSITRWAEALPDELAGQHGV